MKLVRRLLRAIPVLTAVLLSTGILVLALVEIDQSVEARGKIDYGRYQIVRPRSGGIVRAVEVRPGDPVEVGDVLCQLQDEGLDESRRALEAELSELESLLEALGRQRELLATEIHPLELERQRSEVQSVALDLMRRSVRAEELEIGLETLRLRSERMKSLQEVGLMSAERAQEARSEALEAATRLEQGRLEEDEAKSNLASARQALSLLSKTHRRDLAELDRRLYESQQRRAHLRSERLRLDQRTGSLELRAEIRGVVIADRPQDLLGRRIEAGQRIMTVVDLSQVAFLGRVSESEILHIRPGLPVQVEIAGLPRRKFDVFEGEVETVLLQSETGEVSRDAYFPVRIGLARPWVDWHRQRFYLRTGMQGTATIVYRRDVPLFRWALDVLVD